MLIAPHRYYDYGSDALLIEWPAVVNKSILQSIIAVETFLISKLGSAIHETVPAYNSLLVYYDHHSVRSHCIADLIKASSFGLLPTVDPQYHTIPVDYGWKYGLDLGYVAEELNLTIMELIEIHTSAEYTVHFTGFLPGFVYLSGLDERLHIPRRSTPRVTVPKGSVAIAAGQTGIYPCESPGGWHIIGHTSIQLFDVSKDPPSPFRPGDRLSFVAI